MNRLLTFVALLTAGGVLVSGSASAVGPTNPNGRFLGVFRASGVAVSPTTLASSGGLIYHGGPVMRTNTVHAIYWIPSGYSVGTGYKSTTDGFFANVAAANGRTDNVYASDTQYYDTTGPIAYNSTFGGSYVDTSSLPASGCTDSYTSACVTDAQIQAELAKVIAANGWPTGLTDAYFMFTAKGVGSCFDSTSSTCAFSYYCAYHSSYGSGGSTVLYANMPYSDTVPSACDAGQHPNGNDADATLNVTSHEHNETITDPLGTAWFDNAGNENGDLCAWTFGSSLGSTQYGQYNQAIASGKYFLQQEWSNASNSCVLTYGQAPTVPAAPTLTGSAGSATVHLSWVAPNNGGSPIASYKVYRGATSGSETLLTTLGNVTSYDDNTVSNGSTYYYEVSAVNAIGEGPLSNELAATPSAASTGFVGDQNVESSVDYNPVGVAEAFPAVASATGTLSQLRVYLDAGNTSSRVIVGVYSDNGGGPGVLLTSGTVSAPLAGAWNAVAVSGASISSGTKYWLAILQPTGSSGSLRYRDSCGHGSGPGVTPSGSLSSLPSSWTNRNSYPGCAPLSLYGS